MQKLQWVAKSSTGTERCNADSIIFKSWGLRASVVTRQNLASSRVDRCFLNSCNTPGKSHDQANAGPREGLKRIVQQSFEETWWWPPNAWMLFYALLVKFLVNILHKPLVRFPGIWITLRHSTVPSSASGFHSQAKICWACMVTHWAQK